MVSAAFLRGSGRGGASATGAVFVLQAVGPGSALGLSDAAFGLLLTTAALGSLTATLVVARLERRLGRARVLRLAVPLAAVPLAAPALTDRAMVVGVAFALGGAGAILWNVVVVSLRQRIVPDRLLGRVNGAFRTVAWGTRPLGALLGGLVAELTGLRAVFLGSALITLLTGLLLRGIDDRTLDAADDPGDGAPAVTSPT
jgi:MFS family permease